MNDHPIAFQAWESLAEAYSSKVETKPHNALYERPTTLSLLPPVEGRRVLDAGCGPGVYAHWLIDHGAQVVGFDVSPEMLRFARERVGDKAQIMPGDLRHPLDLLEDSYFDIVISSLALD
jgi:SAM-dependent methyltransferase